MAPSSKDYDYKTVGDGQPVGVTVYWEVGVNLGVQARPVGEYLAPHKTARS